MIKLVRFLAVFTVISISVAAIASDDPVVNRTSQQVDMLDALYKTAIVVITDKYVTDPTKFSGASAAKVLFDAMKDGGYHEVRLVGMTDELINPTINKPQDDFEKEAKKQLLSGASNYEEVVTIEGKRYLRKATPVPVVLEKCAMCHANFKDNDGIIGSLMYTVRLIE